MSARRDNNAPVQLPLEHVGLILNEPELVDMRRARENVPVLYFLLFSMLTPLSATIYGIVQVVFAAPILGAACIPFTVCLLFSLPFTSSCKIKGLKPF